MTMKDGCDIIQEIKIMSSIVIAALLLSTVVYANEFTHSGKVAAGVTVRGERGVRECHAHPGLLLPN